MLSTYVYSLCTIIGPPYLKPNSSNSILKHKNSQHLWAMAWYSASELDCATAACFLLFHETKCPPTITHYPRVYLLFVFDIAQSTLDLLPYSRAHDMYSRMPALVLPFKYLRIMWTVAKWTYKNWLTKLTTYEISGCVIFR